MVLFRFFVQLAQVLMLICIMAMVSCSTPKQEAPKPKPDTVKTPERKRNPCKPISGTKYAPGFKQLICDLKLSNQNISLKTIVLAQWMLESGRGNSSLAKKHFNFGGLKWRKEMKPYARPVNYGAHDGKTQYNKFPDQKTFIEGYWHFIDRYPYKGWDKYKENPEQYLRFIVKSGYCPDKGYIDTVLSLHKEAKQLLENI